MNTMEWKGLCRIIIVSQTNQRQILFVTVQIERVFFSVRDLNSLAICTISIFTTVNKMALTSISETTENSESPLPGSTHKTYQEYNEQIADFRDALHR